MIKITEVSEVFFKKKSVEYLGETFIVPYWANYLAIDEDGELSCYECKPVINKDYFDVSSFSNDNYHYIAEVKYEGDWKTSVRKV